MLVYRFHKLHCYQICVGTFRKTDWKSYMKIIEKVVCQIPANIVNSDRFISLLKVAVKKNVLCSYRKAYPPCWLVDRGTPKEVKENK